MLANSSFEKVLKFLNMFLTLSSISREIVDVDATIDGEGDGIDMI